MNNEQRAKTSGAGCQPDKKRLWSWVAIGALALLVRLVFLYQVSKGPTFFTPIIDSGHYNNLAKSLAAGQLTGPTFFWQPVFYPLFFLSRIYLITGNSIGCAKLLQSLFGSVLCVLVYELARRIFEQRTGVAAGVIMAFYGPVMFFDSELVAAGWACIWSVVLILLFLKAVESKRPFIFMVLGICAGLSFITKPTFLLFIAAGVVWLTVELRRGGLMPWKVIAARNAVLLSGLLLVIAPVSIMAYHIKGNFNPLPRYGPINLYIGNNPEALDMNPRPGREWTKLFVMPRQYGYEEAQAGRFFTRRVRDYIKERPFDFAGGLVRKTIRFFSSREIPRTFDMYIARKYSSLFSVLTWKFHNFGFPFALLLPLTLLGLVRHWSRIPAVLILFLIFYPLSIILIFNAARYRVPVIPVMAVPAAAGFWGVIEAIKAKRILQAAVMLAVIIIIAVVSSIAGPFPAEKFNYAAEMHYWVGSANKYHGNIERCVFELSEAVRLNPDYAVAHKLLGQSLHQQGKNTEALGHLETALKLEPELKVVHYYLGAVLLDLGKPDQAIEHLHKALSYARATQNSLLLAQTKDKLRSAESMLRKSGSPTQPLTGN